MPGVEACGGDGLGDDEDGCSDDPVGDVGCGRGCSGKGEEGDLKKSWRKSGGEGRGAEMKDVCASTLPRDLPSWRRIDLSFKTSLFHRGTASSRLSMMRGRALDSIGAATFNRMHTEMC